MAWIYRRSERTKRETCDLPTFYRYFDPLYDAPVAEIKDGAVRIPNPQKDDIWQCDSCGEYWVVDEKYDGGPRKWFNISARKANRLLDNHIKKEIEHG